MLDVVLGSVVDWAPDMSLCTLDQSQAGLPRYLSRDVNHSTTSDSEATTLTSSSPDSGMRHCTEDPLAVVKAAKLRPPHQLTGHPRSRNGSWQCITHREEGESAILPQKKNGPKIGATASLSRLADKSEPRGANGIS